MKMITILLALFCFACVEEEPYYETGTAYVELYDIGYESMMRTASGVKKRYLYAQLNGHDFIEGDSSSGMVIRSTVIPTKIELAEGQEFYHGFIKFDLYQEIEQGSFTAKRIRTVSTRDRHTVYRGRNLVSDYTVVSSTGPMFDKSE